MHFFKRLELHGFKSFANKTSIDLHPGITIVVGPNGCGKSNIFDSIRWVLGEQSAKSLRGERMGDVIFNGSANVKATGLARVSLVMNNRERTLPIDFDEVSISRRLFRTGESEYLLNNTTSRLKDINNLLLDTGIGTEGYSIMEQGKVDGIINAKPLERRAIFDEAAGIAKYKVRKHEALNKLNRTEADLVRLADIIAEVRRQAASLKRQASKAEQYRELTTTLRALEMEMLVRRLFHLRLSTADVRQRHAQLSARVAELRESLEKLEQDEEHHRALVEEARLHHEENQGRVFELRSKLQKAEGRKQLLQQTIESGNARQQQLHNDIERFTQQAKDCEQALISYEKESADVEENLDTLQRDYDERRIQFETLRNAHLAAASEVDKVRSELQRAEHQRVTRENDVRVARLMGEKLSEEQERVESEVTLLNGQIEELGAEKEECASTCEEAQQVLQALQQDLSITANQLKSTVEESRQVTSQLENARRDAQKSQTRHDALNQLQESFEGYYQGVREIMLAAKEQRLHGIRGVVSALISTKPEYELAVEVALGAQAQDIVVDKAENAERAIDWLKENRKGRATLLPLDLMEPRSLTDHIRTVLSRDGVVGVAADLVTFDAELAPAIRHLLGSTIVCTRKDIAVGLIRQGFRARYVTLDGDTVNASGAMSGGSVKASGLLHRTREIKELADALVGLRQQEKTLESRRQELDRTLTELREKHEKLQATTNHQQVETAKSRNELQSISAKLDEKTQQRERLENRCAQMATEQARHQELSAGATQEIENLRGVIVGWEQQLQALGSSIADKQREVSDYERESQAILVTITTARERLSNLRDRLQSGRSEHLRYVEACTVRQSENERLCQEIEQAHAELSEVDHQLATVQQEQESLVKQLAEENEKRETISADLKKLSEDAGQTRRDLNEAMNELHEVELQKSQEDVQLANISTQASEKFAVSIEEIVLTVLGPALGLVKPAPESPAESEETPSPHVAEGESAARVIDVESADEPHENQSSSAEEPAAVVLDFDTIDAQLAMQILRPADDLAREVAGLRTRIEAMGPVHIGAIDEYRELNERFEFLTAQELDLTSAKNQLIDTIKQIDATTEELFTKAFEEIRTNFADVYRRLFGGGRADLILTGENGVLDGGIDIVAQPPGKKPQHISLLSGGEKALTAVALLFAIFQRKPSPFCILDEIDAPLDDQNIERFKKLVLEFAQTTQFIIITHNKATMTLANTLYGVTQQEQGVSRVVSFKLDEFEQSSLAREMALA